MWLSVRTHAPLAVQRACWLCVLSAAVLRVLAAAAPSPSTRCATGCAPRAAKSRRASCSASWRMQTSTATVRPRGMRAAHSACAAAAACTPRPAPSVPALSVQQHLVPRPLLLNAPLLPLCACCAWPAWPGLWRPGKVDYEEFLAATMHLGKLEREENLYRAFQVTRTRTRPRGRARMWLHDVHVRAGAGHCAIMHSLWICPRLSVCLSPSLPLCLSVSLPLRCLPLPSPPASTLTRTAAATSRWTSCRARCASTATRRRWRRTSRRCWRTWTRTRTGASTTRCGRARVRGRHGSRAVAGGRGLCCCVVACCVHCCVAVHAAAQRSRLLGRASAAGVRLPTTPAVLRGARRAQEFCAMMRQGNDDVLKAASTLKHGILGVKQPRVTSPRTSSV